MPRHDKFATIWCQSLLVVRVLLIAIWGNLVTIWCQKIWGEFCCLCAVGGCSAGCLFIAVIALIVVEHAGSVIVVVTVVCYGGGKQVETVS